MTRTQTALTKLFEPGNGDFAAMERFFNESFEAFMRERPLLFREMAAPFMPRIDITEDEKDIIITAELPGIEKKDLEINLREHMLMLKGEKKQERKIEKKDYYRSERTFGAFERILDLPKGIDETKLTATFKDGILTIMAPKTAEARAAEHKIPIK